MDNAEVIRRLSELCEQSYPLSVSMGDADALVDCINRIMESVHDDDRLILRADYDLATSALRHPVDPDGLGNSNKRVRD